MGLERIFPLLLVLGIVRGQADHTRSDGAKGSAIVEAVLAELHDACVYPEDGQLLRRLAFVESRDGMDPATYAAPGSGGIWRVEQSMLQRTQSERQHLAQQYDLIRNKLGIEWPSVTGDDMRRPLYSALAAALFLTLEGSPVTVPLTVEGQAAFWLSHYRHPAAGSGLTEQNFTEPVKNLQQLCARTENMDIVFLVDNGGSVGPSQWNSIVRFVQNIAISLSLHNGIGADKDRVAMITFSDQANVAFGFGAGSDIRAVMTQVAGATRNMGATNISAALNAAQLMVFNQARADAAKVAVLIANGRDPDYVSMIMNLMPLKLSHVTFFTVGVGAQVDAGQLKQIASEPDCSHAYFINDPQALGNLNMAVERISCRVPVVLGPGQYTYPCGFNVLLQVIGGSVGLSVTVSTNHGAVDVFGSYTTQLPSPDLHGMNFTATASTPAVIFTNDLRPLTFSLQSATHQAVSCNGNFSVRVDSQSAKRSDCNKRKPDIAILLDASLVHTDADWTTMLSFVQSFVQQFEVSATSAHFALVSFGDTQNTLFPLVQHGSAADILQALRTFSKPAPTATSDLAAALTYAHDRVFNAASGARSDASKTLVIVTTGQPRDPPAAFNQAESLHALGTRLVVVAVGGAFDDASINALASGPQHVQKLPDLTALTAAVGNIIKEACGEVTVMCVEGGINRECHIEDLINMQYGNFLGPDRTVSFNPCSLQMATGGPASVRLDRFPHPSDADKFLLCDSSGQAYVVLCPLNEVYSPRSHECQNPTGAGVHQSTSAPLTFTTTPYHPVFTTQPPTQQPTPPPTLPPLPTLSGWTQATNAPASGNPCTPSVVISGQFYQPYPADPTKYYHCTTTPFVGQLETCPFGKIWYQAILQCIFRGVIVNPDTKEINPNIPNPCTSSAAGFFPSASDPHSFIQCTEYHEGYLMHCNPGETWAPSLGACQ